MPSARKGKTEEMRIIGNIGGRAKRLLRPKIESIPGASIHISTKSPGMLRVVGKAADEYDRSTILMHLMTTLGDIAKEAVRFTPIAHTSSFKLLEEVKTSKGTQFPLLFVLKVKRHFANRLRK